MRLFVCYLLAALCISVNAFADEAAFRQQVGSRLSAHHPDYPEELKAQHGNVHSMVTFSIDREGKLFGERVIKGSGRKIVDQKVLEWLKSLQPYPKIPAELPAPLRFTVETEFVAPLWNDDRIKRALQNVCRGC